MRFVDWFDPHDNDHMEAYAILVETGSWPKDFGTEVNQNDRHMWAFFSSGILAEAWFKQWKEKEKLNDGH